MVDVLLIWVLKWFYIIVDNCKMSFNVLKIKFKSPKSTKFVNEVKGHLALRLNVTKVFKSEELFELIEYARTVFGVKYLTLICGNFGFEREIDFRESGNNLKLVSFYNNYEQINAVPSSTMSVNLIDNESESLFLLKLKQNDEYGCEYEDEYGDYYDKIYNSTINSFTSN